MAKLIFFDIDGTISSEETGLIPESAVQAIRQARQNGHLCYINTGRTLFSVEPKYREIGFDGYICGCGAAIYENGQCIYHHTTSEKVCASIIQKARETKVTPVYESMEGVYFDGIAPRHGTVERLRKAFGVFGTDMKECVKDNQFTFDKFCFWVTKEADKEAFCKFISPYFDYVDRGNDMYEVMPKGISKATGIQYLCDYHQIPLSDCYAIGDSTNDLAMLQYVPNSIAMGNGMPEIFPYCAYQTDTVENDGLAKALQYFDLI